MAGIVATGIAVLQAQRLARSHDQTAARLVDDYTQIASWNYQRYVSESLRDALIAVLGPVMHFQLQGYLHEGPPPTADWFIDHYIDEASAQYGDADNPIPEYLPRGYFGFTIGADTLGGRGAPLRSGLVNALIDTLSTHIRRNPVTRGAGLLTPAAPGAETVAYTIMPRVAGDTIVYGFLLEPETFRPLFERLYESGQLIPATLLEGGRNRELLDVVLLDGNGGVLYESARRPHRGFHADETLPEQLGGMRTVVTLRADAAGQLIIGGLPNSRLPFLLALLGIATALVLVALGLMRRETALARLRSDFVSSVSHELRTPLAQVRMFLETFRLGRYSNAEQREWLLDNIDRETARITNLVENLLLFSRLDHGRPRGIPEPVDLAAEIRQIVLAFDPLAASRRVHLRTELQGGVVAEVQRGPFRQVVLNLLDNAVKYGPAGQTVTLRLAVVTRAALPGDDGVHDEGSSGPQRFARITVEDMGTGVAPAERTRVWKPFQRGSSAAAGAVGGGGIGLAIVQEVVEQHGGDARVEDAPGGGAAFIVELPCAEQSPDGRASFAPEASASAGIAPSR